ncbi:restriction endonuclease, partial [Salmonella enterica subsp. enterica serovar Kentucky]|nr:restriction endonuclease [Salmonella enterica subsp. enterica serovar Kentucky]ECT1054754.1 restriction endonuclease [Salmonella enterica subsp. enterica serovar Kentucky]EDG3284300.1 restriction endonuclease [Salmonella enterica subsp. enterica serovar Kentucky]EDI3017110.1 restriction endonuclease [Salmonella enterica subsp. enterica serovar Kentucky]EDJ6709883.1 restriction endonuclease [Salmonella enterica subsp. enterica serovar Kentucky]
MISKSIAKAAIEALNILNRASSVSDIYNAII